MNISIDRQDDLNALVTVHINEADYREKVDKQLKSLKNKAFVPGFRPGMVPNGMIKKMYGKQVLSDEVTKLAVEGLYKHLEENNVNFLGDPLLNREKNDLDWDAAEFDFFYDLGLAPEFSLQFPEKESFQHHQIQVDEQTLNDEIEKLRNKYGRNINGDVIEENDLVAGDIVPLDENGEPVADAEKKSIYLLIQRIEDEETRQMFIGKSNGDTVDFNPRKAFKDDITLSIYLGIKADEVASLPDMFRMTIHTISRVVAAEIDQEFFDKLFGEGVVSTEEEMRARIAEFLKADLQAESTAKLFNHIRKSILEETKFELPDEFLKRWMIVRNAEDKDFDPANIENLYAESRDGIRWELIRQKIVKDQNLELGEEEILAESRRRVRSRLSQMGYSVEEERLDELARRLMSSREEAEKIINYLYEIKSLEYLKSVVNVVEETIGYDDFMALLNKQEAETEA